MSRHWRYAKYLARHKWFVLVEAWRLGIPLLGLVHDWSKLRPGEWGPYASYFYGYPRGKAPASAAESFDRAWLAHQHTNKHHYQHWILREDSGATKVLEMPERYRREMLADWRGAGRAVGKPDTRAWYIRNRDHIVLAPETRVWVEFRLGVAGEAA